ncbi:MAG: DUF192 domain-containing protein [Anaerolineales bacterium]|nr:DUF192 domain-containing protein [Anaerolineales bacterium]
MASSKLRAHNRTHNAPLVAQGDLAASWWTRLRGLLGHAPLKPGEGLLLRGENAIHTFGMAFAIDVLFLDRAGRVVHIIPAMPPLRVSPFVARAVDVLELPAGIIAQTHTTLGDQIELEIL